MKKFIVKENERGLLFKNEKFQTVLAPGKHFYLANSYSMISMNVNKNFSIPGYTIDIFLENDELRKQLEVVEVVDGEVCLVYKDGIFYCALQSGKYAFWNIYNKYTFEKYNINETEVSDDFPRFIFDKLNQNLYHKFEVESFEKGKLYFNKKFVKLLDSGIYYFWNNGTKVEVELIDTRILQLDMNGQEIMTADKIQLKLNFVCQYKIADYMEFNQEISDIEKQIYIAMQMSLREYVGKYRLDELLENKDKISQYAFDSLKEKEKDYNVKIYSAGVKDIILPGEIRDIMNTVIIAEKKAQANVITRREEVASTRSLLNTARLMDENKTLYKLKELEYMEKICNNVGNITVNGGSDMISQLASIIHGEKKE